MSFTSIAFLLYFLPVVVGLYYLLGKYVKTRNILLLVAGLLLYVWLEPRYFFVLIVLIALTYLAGLQLQRIQLAGNRGKSFAVVACFICAALFIVFQLLLAYIENGLPLFGLEYSVFYDLIMPVGLGLFTLRSVSYIIDIYRREYLAERNIIKLSLYLSFFPQMVAGPLATYQEFRPQLETRPLTTDSFVEGISRFVTGLAKKVLLGTNLAVVSDYVFALSSTSDSLTTAPVLLTWLGLIAFCLQIYFDLSGYADMAIGLGKIFGFTSRENFRYPFCAVSIKDFWSRWTITFKEWFDTYIAQTITTKRQKTNKDRLVLNTFIMFLVMGFWYKVSIGMAIWAVLQILFLTIEQVTDYEKRAIPQLLKRLYTLFVVILSFALLRSGSYFQMMLFLGNLFGLNGNGFLSPDALMLLKEYGVFLLAGILFSLPLAPAVGRFFKNTKSKIVHGVGSVGYPLIMSVLFLLILFSLARGLYIPYPYFPF